MQIKAVFQDDRITWIKQVIRKLLWQVSDETRFGYDPVGKFMLFCLMIPQISVTFFSLTDIFSRKKFDDILFAGLVCLIFIKAIFFMNG